jgi:hypothetical protein
MFCHIPKVKRVHESRQKKLCSRGGIAETDDN